MGRLQQPKMATEVAGKPQVFPDIQYSVTVSFFIPLAPHQLTRDGYPVCSPDREVYTH